MPKDQTVDDANREADSSSASRTGDTGTSTTAPTQEPTLADVAKEAYDKAIVAEGGSEEGGSGQEVTQTEKEGQESEEVEAKDAEGQEGEGEEAAESGEKAQADPDEKLPFHNHPRWKEVVQQRKELEEKSVRLEQEQKQLEPTVKWVQNHVQFLQQYGISNDEFVQAMNLLALQKTNPAAARQALQPLWESLQAYDENALPSDIQKLVDENEMTPTAAKEMAKLRAQLNQRERSNQLSTEQQRRMADEAVRSSVIDWDRQRRVSDPNFKPKAKESDPDGLWELTAAKYAYHQTTRFAQTPQQAVANLELAYKEAKALLAGFEARMAKKTPPTPNSSRSSAPSKKDPDKMTVDDVVAATAAKHGIHWNGRRVQT